MVIHKDKEINHICYISIQGFNILCYNHQLVRGDNMRQDKGDQKREIKELYCRIHEIMKERDIKWNDLARLIGMSPKTLSSMKSQNVNPSWTTVKRIAKALDVSMDELTYEEQKASHLYELYWAIPREIQDVELQDMTCTQMIRLAYITGNADIHQIRHRNDICKEEIYERLRLLEENN